MLVGARTATWSGKGLSAKSYVQSGLIAMWDGIENAGWGTHDATATTWKDLVGEWDLYNQNNQSFDSDYFWDANCLDNIGKGGNNSCYFARRGYTPQSVVDAINSNALTVEVVSESRRTTNAMRSISIMPNSLNYALRIDDFTNGGMYGVLAGWGSTGSISLCSTVRTGEMTEPSYVCVRLDTGGAMSSRAYYAGVQTDTTGAKYNAISPSTTDSIAFMCYASSSFASGRANNGRFYGCRFYSRALTDAEIAANYAVDRERFNLT